MLIELVAKPVVDRQVVAHAPVVLCVDVQPVRPPVLVAPADRTDCRRGVAEQKVGKRITAELPAVAKRAARVVGLLGPKTQMEPVGAELQPMAAPIDEHVVVQLEVLVVAVDGRRRVTHRRVEPAGRDLREPDVPRVGRDAEQSRLTGKVESLIQVLLAAAHAHVAAADLVERPVPEHVRVAEDGVPAVRVDGAAEARDEAFLQRAGAERLHFIHVERAEAAEQLPRHAQAMIHAHAELIRVACLLLVRGQVLERQRAGRQRHVLEKRGGNRVDTAGRDAIAGKGRADAGRGIDGEWIADGSKAGEIAAAGRLRGNRERARLRACELLPFEAEEGERAVALERRAQGPAVLTLPQLGHRLPARCEVVPGIEDVVSDEAEEGAADVVGARFGCHVDQRRCLAAELRRVHRLLDLELLDGVDRRVDHQVVEQLVGDLHAVEQVDVVSRALTADVRERSRLLQRVATRPSRRDDDGIAELRERKELAAVARNLQHLLVLDHVADLRRPSLQQRRRRFDGDLFRQATDGESEIEMRRPPDLEDDASPALRGEAGERHGHVPHANRQRRREEAAFIVRAALDDDARRRLRDGDQGPGQHGARSVAHDAGHLRRVGLRRDSGHADQEDESRPREAPASRSAADGCHGFGAGPRDVRMAMTMRPPRMPEAMR